MGNKINVKHREETETLKVTEKFIRDFQYHINLVDRSVVGFARSIDSMRASCAVFKRNTKDAGGYRQNKKKESFRIAVAIAMVLKEFEANRFLALKDKQQEQGTIEEKNTLEENLKQQWEIMDEMRANIDSLQETIDDVVSDYKFIALESLSRFFTFIIDNGNGYFTSESQMVLTVDKYRHKNSSDAELNLQYYDARVESLQNKIKTLNKDYQSAKEDIDLSNKRQLLYFDETKILNSKKEDLEREAAKMKLELKNILDAKIIIEQRNGELKNEIKRLRWSEQKVLSQKEEKASEVKTLTENIHKINANFKHRHEETSNTLTECLRQEQKAKEEIFKELHDLKEMKQRTEEDKKDIIEKVSTLEIEIQRLNAEVKEKHIQTESLKEKHKLEMDAVLKEKSKLHHDRKEKETKVKEMETRRESLQEVKSKASLIEAKLSDFMTLMSDEMKTMNSNLKENHTLAECLKLEQTTQEQSAKQLEDLKAVIQQQKQKEQHHEENIKVLTECLQKERKATEETLVQQNKYEMETCIQKIEKLKHKNKEQKEIIKEQANIIRSLNEIEENLTSKMKNEADDRASERESRTAAITSLKEDITKMRKESAAMKLLYEEDKRILVESLEEERNKKEDCFKPLIGRKEKQSQNDESISNLNDEIKRLATEVEEKDKEIVSLQIKLELSSRKVMSVQVRRTAMFRPARVEAELLTILKTRMATEHIDLQFLDCPEFCMVQTDLPVFIFCNRVYMYKRDRNIANAIRCLKDTQKKAALLMFHNRDVRAFQREMDNTEDNTEKIGGIFDIGYKTRIYESETNSRNIDEIIQFLKREGLQRSKDTESVV